MAFESHITKQVLKVVHVVRAALLHPEQIQLIRITDEKFSPCRGEKAFCSVECRCKQISIDEHKEKCGSGAMMKPLEYSSVSPCSSPMQVLAGVAAA